MAIKKKFNNFDELLTVSDLPVLYEHSFSIMFIVSCQVFFINYFDDIFD